MESAFEAKRKIIQAYDDFIIRLYCKIRFRIMNMRILDEIEQYLPKEGKILDIGCGFGLFSLFFASCAPSRSLFSFDINQRRIRIAREAGEKLGLTDRVCFRNGNVLKYEFGERVDGIVVLDLLHHIPKGTVPEILRRFYEILPSGGIAIIKDVDNRPLPKVVFTWVLDKIMDLKTPVHYFSREQMSSMLRSVGFDVKYHELRDILPYPHILYVCRKLA